jgi:hypothetical protein
VTDPNLETVVRKGEDKVCGKVERWKGKLYPICRSNSNYCSR